jgi:hypothetical protein
MTLVISEQRRLHIQLGALSVIQKQSTFKSSFVAISMPNSPHVCYCIYMLLSEFSLNLLFSVGNLTRHFILLIPCSHVKAKAPKKVATLSRRLL